MLLESQSSPSRPETFTRSGGGAPRNENTAQTTSMNIDKAANYRETGDGDVIHTSSTASLNPSSSNNKSPSSRRVEGYDRLIQHPAKLIPSFKHKDEPFK
ncbi:hypothetical protein OIU76_016978 [Salix suchowensis]|nr:hypothetical protein OIU76_016978 [Salix suchowensis]